VALQHSAGSRVFAVLLRRGNIKGKPCIRLLHPVLGPSLR
jgi:hypothetical protein